MRGDSFSWIGEASRFAGQQHTDHVFFISFFLITICRTVTAFGQRPSSSQIFSAISSKMESPRSTALSTSLSDDAKTDTSTMGPSDTLISSTTTFPTESLMGPTWSLSDDDDDAEGVSTGERIAFAPSLPDTLIDEKTATDSQKTSSTVSEATTYPPSMEMIPSERKDHIIPDDNFVAPPVAHTRSHFGITVGIIFGTILAISLLVAGFFAIQTVRRKRSKRRRWLYQLHQDTVPLSEFAPESNFAQTVRHASTLDAL